MAVKPKSKQVAAPAEADWPFGKKNYILFAVALIVIVIGFLLLAQGDTTWTAFFLVVGFCVIIPWAIYAKPSAENSSSTEAEGAEAA